MSIFSKEIWLVVNKTRKFFPSVPVTAQKALGLPVVLQVEENELVKRETFQMQRLLMRENVGTKVGLKGN